jgi:hypothetical protein
VFAVALRLLFDTKSLKVRPLFILRTVFFRPLFFNFTTVVAATLRNTQDRKMKKNKHFALTEKTDKKLSKSYEDSNMILSKNESNRSFSKMYIHFLYPLIEIDIKNETKIKNILTWGIMVWNKAVSESYPNHFHSQNIELIYPLFYAVNNKNLIKEYILRKQTLFNQGAFFIIGYENEWDNKGNMATSLAVLEI